MLEELKNVWIDNNENTKGRIEKELEIFITTIEITNTTIVMAIKV